MLKFVSQSARSMESIDGAESDASIWKPLVGPLSDWPLALCDLGSIEAQDMRSIDVMHPAGNLESYRVYYNQKQRWGYFSKQDVNELLIFKSADSLKGGTGKIPMMINQAILRILKCLIVHLRTQNAQKAKRRVKASRFGHWWSIRVFRCMC